MKNKQSASVFERKNYKWIYLFLLPTIIVFMLFYFIPIVTTLATSFTTWDGFNPPTFNGLENYISLFKDSAFLYSLRNLIVWSILAGTVHVGFGVLLAFLFYAQPFGWKFTRSVFMIPNIISMAAMAVIFKFMFNNDLGIVNSAIRVFFPDFQVQWMSTSPYAFWAVTFTWLFFSVIVSLIVLNALLAIPDELIEAAEIDGAKKWQVVWYIQLPMSKIAIGTSIIASITARVAMYENIALTTGGGPGDDTMNFPLMLVNSITDLNYGDANAIGVVMIIVGLLSLVVINKAFNMNETE